MNYTSNIDTAEVAKFSSIAAEWWKLDGPMETLHVINPCRMQFIQHHAQLANKNVLDIGCGAGILTESLVAAKAKVIGIDASADLIAAAQEHAQLNNLEIDYRATTLEDFKQNSDLQFDVITCMELLEHVPDPAQLIALCSDLLKPGGKLFVSTLSRTLKAYATAIIAAEYVLRLLPKQTHDYKKFIRPAELAQMLRVSDFELQNMRGMQYHPITKSASLVDDVSVNYLMYATKVV